MNLEMSKDELALMEEMLDKALKALPIEIHHTRTNDFKEMLKEKQIPYEEVIRLEEIMPQLDLLYMTRVQKERFFNEEKCSLNFDFTL